MSVSRHTDTIVAPITALGGAVGVVRVSGPEAWVVCRAVFENWPSPVVGRQAVYGRFVHGDDGLVLPFPAGSSYTGEETVEMSVHGSRASVSALVAACLTAGARMAEPGEFTLRAFMNGRIDLTQAEGVRDSVLASTDAQMRQANLLREGALRDQVREIRESVISALAAIEASTDFSEEIGDVDKVAMIERCLAQKRRTDALLETERASRIQREGAVVAIVGRPNAGKSSLLNALLQSDRAIVTDVPGTTRDTIEESFAAGGMMLRLIDTAGLRDSADAVESFGIERSLAAISNADAVIYVYDAACRWSPQDQGLYDSIMRPKIIVANKVDLNRHPEIGIGVSAIQGTGLACLLEEMLSLFAEDEIAPPLINARHAGGLREASEALGRACEALLAPVPTDLVAVDLGVAIRALGEITGETAGVDVIERVFHDFCIGK